MGIYDLSTIYMCRDEYTEMPEKMRLFYESLRRPNQKTSNTMSASQSSFNFFKKTADGMSYSKQIKQKKEISVEDQMKYDLTDFTNKLNDSNYDKLFDQFVTQKYNTTNDTDITKILFANIMIEVLISKVKVDSKFVKLYARLSNDLCKLFSSSSCNFKTKLLKVCNETFMAYVNNSNNKKMEMNSFVAYLSELFMIDTLTEKTMSQCYKSLVQNSTPTNTDMMIKMLQIIYHKLSATAQTHIQNQFEQSAKEGRYSFREQTLLQELMSCDSTK